MNRVVSVEDVACNNRSVEYGRVANIAQNSFISALQNIVFHRFNFMKLHLAANALEDVDKSVCYEIDCFLVFNYVETHSALQVLSLVEGLFEHSSRLWSTIGTDDAGEKRVAAARRGGELISSISIRACTVFSWCKVAA